MRVGVRQCGSASGPSTFETDQSDFVAHVSPI